MHFGAMEKLPYLNSIDSIVQLCCTVIHSYVRLNSVMQWTVPHPKPGFELGAVEDMARKSGPSRDHKDQQAQQQGTINVPFRIASWPQDSAKGERRCVS